MQHLDTVRLHFPETFSEQDAQFVFEHLTAYSQTVIAAVIDAMYLKTIEYREAARSQGDSDWLRQETARLTYLGALQRKVRRTL